MMQSDIFSFAIQSLKNELSHASPLGFNIVEKIETGRNEKQVQFSVTDIFQTSNDKTGQKIIVDEQRFEVPALYEMHIRINIFAPTLVERLSLFGFVAQFFKDHTVYECRECSWHGKGSERFILEPLVRREVVNGFTDLFYLDYKIEVQLNSVKGERFVRVETRDIRTKNIK